MQRHLGFNRDKTELLSARNEYQIVSIDETQSEHTIPLHVIPNFMTVMIHFGL